LALVKLQRMNVYSKNWKELQCLRGLA
jgi:hypothetical protein